MAKSKAKYPKIRTAKPDPKNFRVREHLGYLAKVGPPSGCWGWRGNLLHPT